MCLEMRISLERLLQVKKSQKEEAMHMERRQRLVTEEVEVSKIVMYLMSRRILEEDMEHAELIRRFLYVVKKGLSIQIRVSK
jgi:hypothetical protein